MEKQSHEPKAKMDLSGLSESGASAKKSARVSEKAGIRFESVGGKKIHHHVSEKPETAKEIRFEHIGGRCILRAEKFRDTPDPTDASAESEEDEGGAK